MFLIPLLLFFIVHFVGTISYSPRITGVLSNKLSLSTSLSNILSIVSRSASVMLIPILSKRIESQLDGKSLTNEIPNDYYGLFIIAILASILGFLLFEKAVKLLFVSVIEFKSGSNMLFQVIKSFFTSGDSIIENLQTVKITFSFTDIKYLFLNAIITCIYTGATLAAVYSAYVIPRFRVTSLSFSFLINGIATFIFVTMIDPYISLLTDEAMNDKTKFSHFYSLIKYFMLARIAGVVLSAFTFKIFIRIIVFCIASTN